jgi:hypothetical protein
MSSARRFFAENVAIAATTAVSMETLLKTAGWGYERNLTTNAISTTPSLDSFEGNRAVLLPAADVFVGHDEFVSNAAAAGPPRLYKGALAKAGEKFVLEDFCRGMVDPSQVWFYSTGSTTADLVFEGF